MQVGALVTSQPDTPLSVFNKPVACLFVAFWFCFSFAFRGFFPKHGHFFVDIFVLFVAPTESIYLKNVTVFFCQNEG